MNIIEARNVVKQYENHLALDRVSVTVPTGKIYGLLGPNGAGKTTLIRIINQITLPDSGEVLFNGRPIERNDVVNIGYLPEERGLYKKMAVGELLLYLARLKGMTRSDARCCALEWFERMEIGDWWKKRVEELSKGMAQKIQFISTVIHRPKLLIFDEPFSGFDPVNAQLLKEQILRLKQEGVTIVLSTHNMASVEELCDEITLIHRSRVMLQGEVGSIRRRYKESVIALRTTEPITGSSSLFQLLESSIERETTLSRLRKIDGVTNSQLLTELANQQEILSFVEELPSMNDIFIRIVTTQEPEFVSEPCNA